MFKTCIKNIRRYIIEDESLLYETKLFLLEQCSSIEESEAYYSIKDIDLDYSTIDSIYASLNKKEVEKILAFYHIYEGYISSNYELVNKNINFLRGIRVFNESLIENNDGVKETPSIVEFMDHKLITINNINRIVKVCGWIKSIRNHKRITFIDIKYGEGNYQIKLEGENCCKAHDFLFIEGIVGKTSTGQISVVDAEIVSFKRSKKDIKLDSSEVVHSGFLNDLRIELIKSGYSEAISPILTEQYLGGTARPFRTYSYRRRRELCLKVSSEPFLYPLVGENIHSIYEITPSFRNESLKSKFNEFYMLEFYSAIRTIDDLKQLITNILNLGSKIKYNNIPTKTFDEICLEYLKFNFDEEYERNKSEGKFSSKDEYARYVFDELICPQIESPAFVSKIPLPSSPFYKGEHVDCKRYWLIGNGLDLAEIAENELDAKIISTRLRLQQKNDRVDIYRNYDFLFEALNRNNSAQIVGGAISLYRLEEFWGKE
ncbi:hypothetical protein HRJ45_10105 [Vibrio coralliilyticus]|uniref:amino acid--tRNA ligase-related protein n=1 Tax=Vibrio coralliilyticus TaxID=190893 RepID=UPI001561429D|nr:amino acid--tRNA ligase-related protein [Vibrio coralliilyticus]NRF25482.1 hypothetical protein [Vibrio coralliilyticus]NRF79455.1 hypothetical protein [Vibrio coralliilyticus]